MSAPVLNSHGQHQVSLRSGEVLFLAPATCYGNDIYREAHRLSIEVVSVEVNVDGDFPAEGQPAQSVSYRAGVTARASREAISV